jgi:hypothetical protein
MNTIIKKLHWQQVMIAASMMMSGGLALSLWAISHQNNLLAIIGITLIGVIAISWWFWIMYVVKTLINFYTTTDSGLVEIKYGLRDIRNLMQDYESARQG